MPETSGHLADNKGTTATATASQAAPAVVDSKTERVQAVAESIDKLQTRAQAEAINAEIKKLIPRDSNGKALASAHDGLMDTVSEPELAPPEDTLREDDAPVVEPEPTPEPEATLVPEPEPEPEPTDGKLPQHRVRARDSFDDLVMRRYNNAMRDGSPISMEACIAAEKAAQGILAPVKPADAPAVKGLDAAQSELAALREKRKAARTAFDEVAIEETTTAIEDKLQEIADLKEDARARQQAEVHTRQSQWRSFESQAVALYPEVLPDPKTNVVSEAGKRLIAAKDRLFDEHKNANDPIQRRVDYPLLLLKLAAAEEGIAPSTVKSKTPVVAPKAASTRSVTPAKPAPPLASASARTTQNGTAPQSVAAYLDKGMTLRESKDINKELRKLVRR